jgi:Sec-independent protein secretion pathway component TatC
MAQRKKKMTDDKQPFLGHLEELRKRLVICAIAIGIGFGISYLPISLRCL